MQRSLGFNPILRTRTDFHDEGDSIVISTTQDVTDIIEMNKAQYNAHESKAVQKWKGDMHHVARIPLPLMFALQKRGLFKPGREAELAAWLDDPVNVHFRTKPGKVGNIARRAHR